MAVWFALSASPYITGDKTPLTPMFPTQAAGNGISFPVTVGGVDSFNGLVDFKRTTDITTFPAATYQHVMIFFRWRGTSATLNAPILRVRQTGSVILSITATSTGSWTVVANGTTLATDQGSYSADTWYDIKVHLVLSATVGIVNFYVDNTQIYGGTGLNTGTADINNIYLTNNDTAQYVADIIFADNSGSIFNTFDPAKTYRVATLMPNGAGNSTQFTPSAGSNYDTVNEEPYSATDYNSSNTNTHKDTFAMESMPAGVADILGVMAWAVADMDDATARSLNTVIRHSSSESAGADRALVNGSIRHNHHIAEVNPSTSSVWSESEVNAMEVGYELSV